MRGDLELRIMETLRDVDPEESAVVLAACKARVFYREAKRAHLLPDEEEKLDSLLDTSEVAALLGQSTRWVRKNADRLGVVRIDGRLKFGKRHIRRVIEEGL